MQHRKLTTMLAIVAGAAGFSALAGSAHAAVIQNFWLDMENDPAGEVSLTDGNLSYDWSHGIITPKVHGTFKVVNGDDANFRVHVDSMDSAGSVIGSTYYTPQPGGFKNDAEHDFSFDMTATMAANVASVKIALEKDSSGAWKDKDHAYVPVFYPRTDDVKITDAGIDLGGYGFDALTQQPSDSAKVSYKIEADGKLTMSYAGYLHLGSDFYPRVARVQIRAIGDAGKVFATKNGPARYQLTPAYLRADEDQLSITTADATQLKVKIQEKDPYTGDWVDLPGDAQTVNVAE
jgi:hypothetical protein